MHTVGRVESLWRYPVKSMRGEPLTAAFAGFPGVYGDRAYAFLSSAAAKGFPYWTAREHANMLRYRAAYRRAEQMALPPNLTEAEAMGSGVTPQYAPARDLMVDVHTPAGDVLAIDDPRLAVLLREGARDGLELSLIQSARALTDCRPISLISIQTVRQLGEEVGSALDKTRFRANVYVDLSTDAGFGEDRWVGRTLQIGGRTQVAVTARDNRCKMITLDPETAQTNPDIIRRVADNHDGCAGLYAAVLAEGVIRPGDEITLLD